MAQQPVHQLSDQQNKLLIKEAFENYDSLCQLDSDSLKEQLQRLHLFKKYNELTNDNVDPKNALKLSLLSNIASYNELEELRKFAHDFRIGYFNLALKSVNSFETLNVLIQAMRQRIDKRTKRYSHYNQKMQSQHAPNNSSNEIEKLRTRADKCGMNAEFKKQLKLIPYMGKPEFIKQMTKRIERKEQLQSPQANANPHSSLREQQDAEYQNALEQVDPNNNEEEKQDIEEKIIKENNNQSDSDDDITQQSPARKAAQAALYRMQLQQQTIIPAFNAAQQSEHESDMDMSDSENQQEQPSDHQESSNESDMDVIREMKATPGNKNNF